MTSLTLYMSPPFAWLLGPCGAEPVGEKISRELSEFERLRDHYAIAASAETSHGRRLEQPLRALGQRPRMLFAIQQACGAVRAGGLLGLS
jgi:hypothetical protein